MGKKTSTNTKGAPAEKRAAKPSSKAMRAAEQAVIAPPAKPAAPKKPAGAGRSVKPAQPAPAAYTDADISLRAYYISEKRMAAGLPGDSHQDWLEAERQLMAQAAAMAKPKAKTRKT